MNNKIEGRYDFEKSATDNGPWKTFSIGIFKWMKRSENCGPGLKKSAAVCRVKGKCSDRLEVYKKASQLCKIFNEGGFPENKIYTV